MERPEHEDEEQATEQPRDRDEERRQRAYMIWEGEGRPEDRHLEHWQQAGNDLGHGSEPVPPDSVTAETPSGTKAEREARGNGDQPIPASAPRPNGDASAT